MKSPLFRYKNFEVEFSNFQLIKVSGPDSQDYLQRQLTSDVASLEVNKGHMSSRLDRTGRVKSFFYVFKTEESFLILVDKKMSDSLKEELDKFHIMEDMTIEFSDEISYCYLTTELNGALEFSFCDLPAFISFSKVDGFSLIEEGQLDTLIFSSAWPVLGKTLELDNLVNESRLNELAVSYSKGCFLGQETAAKIETRRGAALYPGIIKSNSTFESNQKVSYGLIIDKFILDGELYYLANLKREFRVEGMKVEDDEFFNVPLFKDKSSEEKSKSLYLRAVNLFHTVDKSQAVELLDLAIKFDRSNADAYESKGAILGQLERYEEAIGIMDELLKVDENSVMAHTNKSLFLMKLGKIEEAEEEKALATVANFKRLGDEAKAKRESAEAKEKEIAEEKRKESMFLKVLGLDAEDEIANFGLGSILYRRKDYKESVNHLKIVVKNNEKYSAAYAILGKSYEALGEKELAINTYRKGIEIASSQGDLMPANEMQSRLNTISNSV